MPIVNTKQMLQAAQKGGYAVGAFNVENMEFVQAVIEAAEEMASPIIVATSVNTLKYAAPEIFSSITTACAQRVNVPVAMHLDHGEKLSDVMAVIRGGYTSVMFDGSKCAYAENMEGTKMVVEMCKAFAISVEGELGAVGGKPGDMIDVDLMYTRPEIAADFVEKTGVDSLAVAIGTAHGVYKSTPRLDYDRLTEIREKVDVPLVLHGASGLTEEQMQTCVQKGICKVNVATELRIAWTDTLKRVLAERPDKFDPKVAAKEARNAVKEIVKEKIRILGSAGKA